MRLVIAGVAAAVLAACATQEETTVTAKAINPDTHLYLEEVEGEQALGLLPARRAAPDLGPPEEEPLVPRGAVEVGGGVAAVPGAEGDATPPASWTAVAGAPLQGAGHLQPLPSGSAKSTLGVKFVSRGLALTATM